MSLLLNVHQMLEFARIFGTSGRYINIKTFGGGFRFWGSGRFMILAARS